MKALINGDTYTNSGRVSTCYNPHGLLGSGRWKFQSESEFIAMVNENNGKIIKNL